MNKGYINSALLFQLSDLLLVDFTIFRILDLFDVIEEQFTKLFVAECLANALKLVLVYVDLGICIKL